MYLFRTHIYIKINGKNLVAYAVNVKIIKGKVFFIENIIEKN